MEVSDLYFQGLVLERIEYAPTRCTTWSRDSVIAAQAAIQIAQNWISAFAEMTDGTSLIRCLCVSV
jgi:hypothetical protein